MYTMRFAGPRAWCVGVLVLVFGFFAGSAWADPPNRVARVSYLGGNVSFQPAGDDQWAPVSLNRPLITGDKVYTDKDSRIELQIGAADIRLDAGSTFDLLNLDDTIAQMELTNGVMNLRVRYMGQGQTYEVDTPTLAFVVMQPGNYRVDIDPQGHGTMVTVFDGGGTVYGEKNASYNVRAGNSYRFNDSVLHDYEVLDIPQPDDFDQWCRSRDAQYTSSVSSKYVPQDMIGYTDLDANGSWATEPDYGNVWYPNTVAAGWAPYSDGYWSWIDPWGWTWVDNAAWGFAPFHYGRWAYVGSRWGWVPGPVAVGYGAMYSPAMVAFAGGLGIGMSIGAGPVGWFPLGPRDMYVPWYGASRAYFTNVNMRNARMMNNAYMSGIYGNYAAGRPITNINYAYRNNAAAFTAVPRDVFAGARPVGGARMAVDANMLRGANVVSRLNVAPTRASFASAAAPRGGAPRPGAFDRGVIARTAPPAAAMSIGARMEAIQRNGAQPLTAKELRGTQSAARGTANAAPASRVQVVGQNARPRALPTRGAATAGTQRAAGARPAPGAGNGAANSRGPVSAPANARDALPSSRFAPHSGAANTNGAAASARSERGTQSQSRGSANRTSARSQSAQTPHNEEQAQRPQQRENGYRSQTQPSRPASQTQQRGMESQVQRAQRGTQGTQPQEREQRGLGGMEQRGMQPQQREQRSMQPQQQHEQRGGEKEKGGHRD